MESKLQVTRKPKIKTQSTHGSLEAKKLVQGSHSLQIQLIKPAKFIPFIMADSTKR